ncbi:c-type cytochrome [Paenibacillus sp. 1P07SE]|uniref:c-type cytochrome n=1 Tax=Paenibacillus sp. 1P07SE TaxID=3132209 RepID=UPI0039A5208E
MRDRVMRTILLCSAVMFCFAPSMTDAVGLVPQAWQPAEVASAPAGGGLYKQHCLACHGTDLRGKVGPDLSRIGSQYTKQELEAVIGKGRGGMPGFSGQMTPAEIRTLANWLVSHK